MPSLLSATNHPARFTSSCSPSPSAFLFVPSRPHLAGPCFAPSACPGSASSPLFLPRFLLHHHRSQSPRAFVCCSTSARATAFSKCPSSICCSLFHPSRPSTLCSVLVLILVLHALLCGIGLPVSISVHPLHPSVAPYALTRSSYSLLTVGSGAATVARVSHSSRFYTGTCSSYPGSARLATLASIWCVVSSSAWHGVGWHSSTVQHFDR